ncbi:hypothetical protein HID58_011369 [Brassica napus]|uniref:UBC core domain-containing protein n=1 Tax=Brassica napus TaxID=3708 RepID=A0ABQ8DYH6_BRANA|nr:hypothetical protein HID58_011369 [Brassica napus]
MVAKSILSGDRSMKPEIVYTTLTPNKGTTPGAMQNGGVLDNNNVDNKNKGKAIQLGSLSEDDHQLEESASEGYDTTHNDEYDPGSSPQSDSLLDPDALIYEDDSDHYGYEMELEEEEEEEADDYVSEYQALFDAKEKELPAGVEVTMDWLPNSKSSGSNKSSREDHGIKLEATSSSKKPKKLPHNSKGFTPNSAYALPQIYLDPQAPVPVPAPAVPAPASSTVLLPTQNKPKGIYNARPDVQEVISDSNTCRVKRNMDDYLGKFVFFKRFDIVEDLVDHQYASKGTASKKHSKEWAKRIQEEWRTLENDLPEMIFVRAYESRMDLLRAVIIGADGTPYHDGLFFFDIFFPDTYPSVPPVVHYHSGGLRINPNLYNSGKVCLSLLGTWSGAASQMWIPTKSTMLQYFEDFSYGHFFSCAHDVLKACDAYRNGAPVASLEFILLGVLGLEPEEEDKPSETKVAESSRSKRPKRGGVSSKTKLTEEHVKSTVCDAVEIEREFVCDALPCALVWMTRELMSQYIEGKQTSLRRELVALYVGGLYICGKIGWESVMKMGQDTRELFFYETFIYYNPLLLITMMVWLWGVNLWVFSRTGVDYAAIFYLGPDHHSHKEIWKIVLYLSAVIILITPFDIFYKVPTKKVEEPVVVTEQAEEVVAATESAPAPVGVTEQSEAPVEGTSKEVVVEEAEKKDEETEKKPEEPKVEEEEDKTETPVIVEEAKTEEKEEVTETLAVVEEEKKAEAEEVVAAGEVAAEKTEE